MQKIALRGPRDKRLDHLALDAQGSRLFVANMANASLDIVDLKNGTLLKQIPEQKGIQGIAYAADLKRIFVGVGEVGVCNVFDADNFELVKSLPFPDADNVRYDSRTQRVYVAHADKALAVINGKSLEVLADIKLPGQPESFQLEKDRPRLYLNASSSYQLAVIDTDSNKVINQFPLTLAKGNFPLALDEAEHRLFVGCRNRVLAVLDSRSGRPLASAPLCDGVDTLIYDAKVRKVLASCNEGVLDVFDAVSRETYPLRQAAATAPGARTMAFDERRQRIYLPVADKGPLLPKSEDVPARPAIVPETFRVLTLAR